MANPIEYIWFEPDQVLTNDHLNETFHYLDQQNRWTRNKLIGIGIVCGLDIVLKPGIIEITKGCGITSQGYLITQDTTDYTYYIPYTPVGIPTDLPFTHTPQLPFFDKFCEGRNVWQLISDPDYQKLSSAQQLTAVTISSATNFLKDYVVVLFLEMNETDLKNCNMLDCNNSGATIALNIRPLLVATADLPAVAEGSTGVKVINTGTPDVPQPPVLKRYNVPYADLANTNDVINAFVNLVDDATLTLISKAYTYCFKKYGDMLNVSTDPFANLLVNLQKYRSLIVAQNPVYIQYFYDLADDLVKAYYEFIVKVTDIQGVCCPDENLFPLHLILGAASTATSAYAADANRNYFIHSDLFSRMGDENAGAGLLFNRMVILANSFTIFSPAAQLQSAIKITPSQYEHFPLSRRAIPYYYKLNTAGAELYKYWNYYKTSHGDAAGNLSYNANLYSSAAPVVTPLLYDIERFNFFRVEGHIGQQQSTALANIQGQVSTYNLPFDVVAVSADQLASGAVLPKCSMNDLDVDYNLITNEAACKIHLIFCFITKLPYISVASKRSGAVYYTLDVQQPKVPKFSAFKMSQETLLPSVVKLDTAYKKGDFLRTYCPAVANTIGSGYLASLSSTGVFTNPIQINQGNALTVFYYYLFEFVDAVESLMYQLNANTLAQLNIEVFNTAYQRYIADALLVITLLTEATITIDEKLNDNSKFVSLAEDLQLDLLMEEMTLLTTMCIEERIKVLLTEYNNRLTNYQQQLNFLTYFKNHNGLEHKAGVPKGGTFVLVYHSGDPDTNIAGTATTTTNANGDNIALRDIAFNQAAGSVAATQKAVTEQRLAAADYNISDSDLKLIRGFVNDCSNGPADTKQKIIGILKRIPKRPPQQTYSITDGTVIADFYIPYLCCSDCPPVAYITTGPAQPKPTLTMGTSFCVSDTHAEPVTALPAGGTFNTVKGLDAAKKTFTPSTAGVGTYTITYTLNGVDSDPVTVRVLAVPNAPKFTVDSTVKSVQDGIYRIDVTFSVTSPDKAFTYDWEFGKGFPETTDSGAKVEFTFIYDPEKDGTIETSATLTASNGTCTGDSTTVALHITANGVFEGFTYKHESGFIGGLEKGIKNVFNKKKKKS